MQSRGKVIRRWCPERLAGFCRVLLSFPIFRGRTFEVFATSMQGS